MSKKTKEEKRIAAYRKKLKLLKLAETANSFTIPTQKSKIEKLAKTVAPLKQAKEEAVDQSRQIYFLKDLKKSAIIIFLIITLEIIIYFVRIKDYLKLGI